MRKWLRLTLLSALTGIATFLPPYPSNANFPPDRDPSPPATSMLSR